MSILNPREEAARNGDARNGDARNGDARNGDARNGDMPDGAPLDHGWSIWSGGSCSITRCIDHPVAAIERTRGMRRPPYWQPYCAEHARARGVEREGEALVWTADFLQPRGRAGSLRGRKDPATGA